MFAAQNLTDRAGDGGKREKVERALLEALPTEIPWLARSLVELLWEAGLQEPSDSNERELVVLRRRLEPFGVSFDAEGVHLQSMGVGTDDGPLLSSDALRAHIERIHRALDDDDSEQVLGSAKELLESTAKLVLNERSLEVPSKFPALMHSALDALGLHPKAVAGDDEVADATRRILGALNQIAVGVNELRRDFGTGHGRVGGPKLSLRHARLSAGAATTLATLMIDTLEDPNAPWRRTGARERGCPRIRSRRVPRPTK